MAINKKPHFRGSDFNNQELKDAKSLQLNQDAVSADEAVRKSQSESIADAAAQDILINAPGSATGDTAFTSSTMMGFLAGKQDNMEIDASSSAYLQIVDGYKIKATQLLITDVEVDETYSTLASFIAGTSPAKQQGDVVILAAATDNQERSWIKSSSASQNADGYVRLQTDYNVTSIRAMFNAGAYMDYSPSTGQFSVNLGTLSYELGAQTLPIDDSTFASASGNNMFDLAKSLESLILNGQTQATQATTTVDTRISSCTGVTGSNLGSFSGRFTNDSTIKDVLTETEQDLTSSETDRAAIRAEFASADNGLQSSINTEAYLRAVADSSEASSRIAGDNAANSRIDTTNLNLGNEEARAVTAESVLGARLNIVEGGSSVNGSIAKAQVDAQAFATNAVSNEAGARQAADLVLQTQIDAIADAFQYKGNITTGIRIDHVDSTDSNHDKVFANASFSKGDMYKMNIGGTITFTDSTEIDIFVGDSLVCINDATIGTATAADFHLWDNSESSDLLREGQLDANHLERVNGVIGIVDDSIDRVKLSSDVEADIDSKLEKAGGSMTGALGIEKTVLAGTGYVGGYDFAAHVKQISIGTESLTDTQRALLVENDVYSDGSGNPLDLDYANATTSASHYKGASADMSIATVGTHSEGSVASAAAKVYATGAYGVATSTQLGVNSGGTFVAQNAATSNLGVFAFSDTAGALNNRAGYLALSPDNVDLDAYRVARVASPLPVQDAVLVLDDYTGEKHALYANGKVEFAGKTIVQSASADDEAVNLGDVKAKEYYQTFTVNGDDSVVINHGLGSKKLIVQLWFNDEEITSSFDLEKSSDNSITVHNDSVDNLTGLEICIIKLSV